jgi:Domain of unknown function (DUF4760)
LHPSEIITSRGHEQFVTILQGTEEGVLEAKDWVATIIGAAALLLSAGGLLFVAAQVRLLRLQIRHAEQSFVSEQERARRHASLEFITSTMERRSLLLNDVPSGGDKERVEEFMRNLGGDTERRRQLSRYLSHYEALATGVNLGVLDVEVVDRAWGSVIIRAFEAYQPYIESRRRKLSQPQLYSELECLVDSLKHRRQIGN